MKKGVRIRQRTETYLSKKIILWTALIAILVVVLAFSAVEITSRINFKTSEEQGSGSYNILKTEDVSSNSSEKVLSVYATSRSENLEATASKIARDQFKRFLWKDKAYDKIYVFVWHPENIKTNIIPDITYVWIDVWLTIIKYIIY